jgi:hypothetical protein
MRFVVSGLRCCYGEILHFVLRTSFRMTLFSLFCRGDLSRRLVAHSR